MRKGARDRLIARDRPWLQWGRNLSVAEGAARATMARREAEALQWGRNLSVAEGNEVTANIVNANLLQWGRNLSVAEGSPTIWLAPYDYPLQWGRNLSVAEGEPAAAPPPLPPRASMGPQPFGCGRHLLGRQHDVLSAGFNGAATFRLRKAPTARAASSPAR